VSGTDFINTGTIQEFGDPITVSTLTELRPFAAFGIVHLDVLEVVLENQDGTNAALLTVDVSEGGRPNLDAQQQVLVQHLSEGSVRFTGLIPTMLRVSASGDPATGYPAVAVRYKIRGRRAR
jgi:hypothetical protein